MTRRLTGALLALLAAAGCAAPDRRGDVLLVILDTTRADHLSAYGYPRVTTPALDRLAAEGRRYDNAWSQAPWTLPSIATILTGQPPHVHGAGRGVDGMYGLRSGVTTLAERLRDSGYRTGAFINVVWCDPKLSALDRGFDHYDFVTTDESNRGQRDAAETTDAALAWIEESERPTFTVVHYFDPHLTYDPPPPYDTMFVDDPDGSPIPRGFGSADQVFQVRDGRLQLDDAERRALVARYDGELRFTDEQFSRLRAGLEGLGRWDDALVIVVADHGEEFWDHGGFEHGHTHYREMLRIPLIVKHPGAEPGVDDGLYRQLDVAPTVLDFAALDRAGFPGVVLGAGPAAYAVAEGSLWSGDLVSVRGAQGTAIVERRSGAGRYYAPGDTYETTPEELPAEAAGLAEIVRSIPAQRSRDRQPAELSEEQLERLRNLGYIR